MARRRTPARRRAIASPKNSVADGVRVGVISGVVAPMPGAGLLPLAIALAGELAELHGRGAIHEDLRPANILEGAAAGQVVLASSGNAARGSSLIAGSLPYMSPEQTGQMNRPI